MLILRTGAPGRDLPEEFDLWQTAFDNFNRWSSDGTLGGIFASLKEAFADAEEFDHRLWAIDGTVIRAARCAAAVYEAMIEHRRGDK